MPPPIPPTPVKPLLVATNQGDRDLSIIDPVAAKQLATVPEGGITGHEVATSPDGQHRLCAHLWQLRCR